MRVCFAQLPITALCCISILQYTVAFFPAANYLNFQCLRAPSNCFAKKVPLHNGATVRCLAAGYKSPLSIKAFNGGEESLKGLQNYLLNNASSLGAIPDQRIITAGLGDTTDAKASLILNTTVYEAHRAVNVPICIQRNSSLRGKSAYGIVNSLVSNIKSVLSMFNALTFSALSASTSPRSNNKSEENDKQHNASTVPLLFERLGKHAAPVEKLEVASVTIPRSLGGNLERTKELVASGYVNIIGTIKRTLRNPSITTNKCGKLENLNSDTNSLFNISTESRVSRGTNVNFTSLATNQALLRRSSANNVHHWLVDRADRLKSLSNINIILALFASWAINNSAATANFKKDVTASKLSREFLTQNDSDHDSPPLTTVQFTENALVAAHSVRSEAEATNFLATIGLTPLVNALLRLVPLKSDRSYAVRALCKLARYNKPVCGEIAAIPAVMTTLCDLMEAPMKGFRIFQSNASYEDKLYAQNKATALVQLLVRSSDDAVQLMQSNIRLRKVLARIVLTEGNPRYQSAALSDTRDRGVVMGAAGPLPIPHHTHSSFATYRTNGNSSNRGTFGNKSRTNNARKTRSNSTVIIDYQHLTPPQMARVASWGIGGVPWKPKQPGQRGLRILSLDGGGTKGVTTIAYMKELMKRVNSESSRHVEPWELFDMVVGTSTGAIITMLLGAQCVDLERAEQLYDELISEIFKERSRLRLVREQAAYDVRDFEQILNELVGDQLLLDTNQHECPRVACISTKVNIHPPQPKLWRNYNLPPGQKSRYPGAFRINLQRAVRASTAAPMFFTPVQWEGGLYCDGALVANNPTALALQEAKVLYPGVPIEMVVSVGTGYAEATTSMQSMGWETLVNRIVASSTSTENVHYMLSQFLSDKKYFRFNPTIDYGIRIDEKNTTVLRNLKSIAKKDFAALETGERSNQIKHLIKMLAVK